MEPEIKEGMLLERLTFTDESTIGELSFDGIFTCFILEDTCRDQKIAGKTAIPPGRYEIIRTHSPRFNKELPLLLDVPHYEGVRIHPGNTAVDTEGCLLPGLRKGDNVVYDSVKAFGIVDAEIQDRLKKGKLFISIIGGRTHV